MKKTNEQLLQEFENSCKMTIEEWKDSFNKEQLIIETEENPNEQTIEVDDIDDYMKSLGFSSLEEIKDKYYH